MDREGNVGSSNDRLFVVKWAPGRARVVSSGFLKARPSDLCICVGGKSLFGIWQGEGGGKMGRGCAAAECNRTEIYVNCPLHCKTP